MSTRHLKLIRQCPCTIERAYTGDIEAHHLMDTGKRGMGQRSPDCYAIPLSASWHTKLHAAGSRNETEFLLKHGVCGLPLAAALWALSQSPYSADKLENMRRAVMGHEK